MRLNWKKLGKPIHHPLVNVAKAHSGDGVLSYLKLAIRIATLHARIAPSSLHDDLVSVAVEALVAAYNEQDCFDYIIRKVHTACTEFLRCEYPSINSTRHAQNHPTIHVEAIGKRDFDKDPQDANELWELILSTAENPLERDILHLRREGYTDKEIGEKRNITGRHVCYIREILEKRFQLLERRLDEET